MKGSTLQCEAGNKIVTRRKHQMNRSVHKSKVRHAQHSIDMSPPRAIDNHPGHSSKLFKEQGKLNWNYIKCCLRTVK